MTVIPVIDLMHGQVVRAAGGLRSTYRPIVSGLCGSSDPLTVARILCDHCEADRLYIADLDALQGGLPQLEVLRRLMQALPGIECWLDAGFTDEGDVARVIKPLAECGARVAPVFGSESLRSTRTLAARSEAVPGAAHREPILSLDRRGAERLDPAGCWESPSLWPRRVIVMTLERVGSGAGPDLDLIRALRGRSPHTELIGAGGVRHPADLDSAREAGAAAWLVASALHDGQLPRQSLRQPRPTPRQV
ncbi:HisA/HisF-related TIM barrel protein [Ideonella sp. DXS29W]|uniref:HisA/HisF-related TIM barrel protein n=1 Tax=Ideonella lacteola TaxID=2984193 RepID=A0ABU9BIC4_9BURK